VQIGDGPSEENRAPRSVPIRVSRDRAGEAERDHGDAQLTAWVVVIAVAGLSVHQETDALLAPLQVMPAPAGAQLMAYVSPVSGE
jgi:hypothetical protein